MPDLILQLGCGRAWDRHCRCFALLAGFDQPQHPDFAVGVIEVAAAIAAGDRRPDPGDLIFRFDHAGIFEVCRQQREWLDRGLHVPQVAVNLSARQFRHPDLVGLVAQALRDNALQPQLLGLEITESAAMHDVESAIATNA